MQGSAEEDGGVDEGLQLTLLSSEDRAAYDHMVANFLRNKGAARGGCAVPFERQLMIIHAYAKSRLDGRAERQMACGIFYGPGYVILHNHRLRKVLGRSKSGMNLCMQKLGYDGIRPSNDIIRLFKRLIPGITEAIMQTRQWALRTEVPTTQIRFQSLIPLDAVMEFESTRLHPLPAVSRVEPHLWDLTLLLNRLPAPSP